MLKSYPAHKYNVDVSSFSKTLGFLKRQSDGYHLKNQTKIGHTGSDSRDTGAHSKLLRSEKKRVRAS